MTHATPLVRLSPICVAALAAALLAPSSVAATQLAPFIDLQEAGLTTVVDGEGLQSWDRTTPVNLTVNVGGTVRFALLYWAGSDYPCDFNGTTCTFVQPFRDQQMIFNGTAITGTVIGTETWADHPGGERLNIGYFADVTSLVSAAGPGLHSFTFADGNAASDLTELDGATLYVAYTNASDSTFYRVLVWDGLDFASGLAAPGDPRTTAPVTFGHGAVDFARTAELTLIAGDGDASCDRVTVANNPDLVNTLDGSFGPDWDADTHLVTIPAGVDSTAVQVHAEPDDLLWEAAMLRIALPPAPDEETVVADPLGLEPTVEAGRVAPLCQISTSSGPPFQVFFTIQDTGSGVVSIVVTESTNADTVVPPFIPGTTEPIAVTSTKIDQTSPLAIEMLVTDGAGNVENCAYEEGLVTIVKDTVPDDAQDFTFIGSQAIGSFDLDDEGGGDATLPNERSFIVPVGSFCVAEAVAPGFDLTNIVCDDADSVEDVPNRTAHAVVGSLEEVTCTFTNAPEGTTPPGTLIVVKDTVPDGPQDFPFTGSGIIGAFTLDDDAGADATFSNTESFVLPPGDYTVSESVVPGFTLASVACSDGSPGDPATRTATVALASGETVTCTFTNNTHATLTIVKDTVPDGPQDFAFTGSGTIGAFTLDDDAGADATFQSSTTFTLDPGAYTVSEAAVAGFGVTGIACSDGDSVGTPATRTAAVALAAGETVTCTFTNTAGGNLTIVQDTVPDGPQDFAFTGSAPIGGFTLDDDGDPALPSSMTFALAPGAYTVTQAIVPGFTVGAIVCSDGDSVGDPATRTAAIALAPGETVTCTFSSLATPAAIPTLGEWAALLLGLGLAALGVWRARASG